MKSVAKLRFAGFTVAATNPDVAVDCTTVASPKPFYYFNPKFASTPREIFEKLTAAPEVSPGVFEFVIAGKYFREEELPFAIILPASQKTLEKHYNRCLEAAAEVARLKKELDDEMADFEAITKSIVGE